MRVHKAAAHGLARHWLRSLLLLFAHIAARAAAFSPFGIKWIKPDIPFSFPLQVLICLAVYALLIYPLRFAAAALLCGFVRDDASAQASKYPQLVCAGLIRMVTGGLWGVPFMACAYIAYLYGFVYDASRAGAALTRFGQTFTVLLPSVNANTLGLYAAALILLLTLVLFVLGWHRGVCYDFLLKGDQFAISALRQSKQVRKSAKGDLFRNLLIHMMLLIPPCLAFCLILSRGFDGLKRALLAAQLALLANVYQSPDVFIKAAIAFLILYLPLILYRKARNAAVVVYHEQDS